MGGKATPAGEGVKGLPLGSRSVLFVGGKGGVGKTTVAAGVGLALAGRGERILLVSTDPAHSLGDLFQREIGAGQVTVWKQPHGPGALTATELDAEAETERYLDGVRDSMRAFVRPALYPEIERQIALTRHAPGAQEAALMDRIADLMTEGPAQWDRVIFDTAPTGHTLRMLALPELMAAWTDGLLQQRERSDRLSRILRQGQAEDHEIRSAASPSLHGPTDDLALLDDQDSGPRDPRLRRLRERLLTRRRRFVEARKRLLAPETVGFILVLIPERLPILETQTALGTLTAHKVPVVGLVVNRTLPPEADGAFLEARRVQERHYLEDIETRFAALPRVQIPLAESDVQGLARLEALGARILGADVPG